MWELREDGVEGLCVLLRRVEHEIAINVVAHQVGRRLVIFVERQALVEKLHTKLVDVFAHGDLLGPHLYADELSVLDVHGHLRITISEHRPVVDVRTADNQAPVIHDHQLGVRVHLRVHRFQPELQTLLIPFTESVVMMFVPGVGG